MSVSIVQGDLAALTVHLEKAAVPVAAAAPTAADASASAPAVPAAAPSIPDIPRSLDVLRAMLALPRVTADELRVTSAGKLVQRLSKSGEAAIAALAKELLAKWKAQVLPPPPSGPTGVEKAKQEAAAAAQKALAEARAAAAKKKAEAEAAAAAAAAKKSEASGDSDSDADGKKSKKDKKRRDKEESAKKRSKTDEDSARASPPASAVSKLVAASKNEKSLATQHPHLTAGPYALFATNDDLRDKMQLMFWQAIGEPSADVIAQTAAATGDLNAYKPAHAHKKHDESKSAGTPSMAPSPSPSPPPIANIALSSPSADAAAPASATPSSAAPASASAATASTSAPSAPVFRSRIELAFLIEQAMFNKLGPSSSTAYRQVSDAVHTHARPRHPPPPPPRSSLCLSLPSSRIILGGQIRPLRRG